jgi:hypothetical protein
MPSSGGSVSDAPVNKVVDGQSHYLAYITPDEGKSLTDQGGKEVITDSGIPAYPPQGRAEQFGGTTSSNGKTGNGDKPGMLSTPQQQAEQFAARTTSSDQEQTKENLITKVKDKIISKTEALNIASKLGWVTDNAFVNALGGAWGIAMSIGEPVQKKAMTWGINSRLKNIQKKSDFHPGIYGSKIADLNKDLAGIEAGTFSQKDYTEKYGSGDLGGEDRRDGDARGLTNIITPYAAHAIGGTTQQSSMAAQWYAGLGGGPSNPGAFNLTQQYAAAKAAVSQRLGTPTSVGQMAVSNSPFFNFLKDNSLDKGIL